MKIHLLFIISIFTFASSHSFSQSNGKDIDISDGILLEYNTIIISHDIKLYSDFNLLKNNYINLTLQPGTEFIYGISGAEHSLYYGNPYYDFNLLCGVYIFPNSRISLRPFIGPIFRISSAHNHETYFNIKYGTTLYMDVSKKIKVIFKAMNSSTKDKDDISVIFGVGFIINVF